MRKLSGWERVGEIGVDAGLCWVGDPCYLLQDTGSGRPKELGKDWKAFCDLLWKKEDGTQTAQWNYDHGRPGLGVTVATGWGDGTYDVYVRRAEGRVKAVMVVFDEDAAEAEGVE